MVASIRTGPPQLLPRAERSRRTLFQKMPRVDRAEVLDHRGHESGPPGLVAGTEAGAVVAVEILMEQQQIAPVGIGLERLLAAEHGAAPVRPAFPDRDHPPSDFLGDLV